MQSSAPDTTAMTTRHFRTLWLSDIHLGTIACRAADLHRFLAQVSADTIYLVGDIVDIRRMKSRPIFPAEHRLVIGRLIELAHGGTRVVFIPGNHDEEFRRVTRSQICGVVCGHIHRPAIRRIGGVRYANDGDWVEHRTAIAEDRAGEILLLSYSDAGVTVLPDDAAHHRVAA